MAQSSATVNVPEPRWLRNSVIVIVALAAISMYVLSRNDGAILAENTQLHWIPAVALLGLLAVMLVGLHYQALSTQDRRPVTVRDHMVFIAMEIFAAVAFFTLFYFISFWAFVLVFVFPIDKLQRAYLRKFTSLYDDPTSN